MNKKYLVIAALVTAVGIGGMSTASAYAETTKATQNPMSSLVQKIAEKFNLNQAEVQAVFDEAHKADEASREARFEAQLSQYVTDGKITEAQKQLILQKHTELQSQREANRSSMQNLSDDARKAKMEEERTSLQAWATQNGIDMQFLMPQGGRGHGGGHMGKILNGPTTPTVTK